MARPDPRAPGAGQAELFGDEPVPAVQHGMLVRGRHANAVDAALQTARAAELIRPEHDALATFVRHAAWTADMTEHQGRPTAKATAALVSAVSEAIKELGLTPAAIQSQTDEALLALLDQIGQPVVVTDDDTQIPH